MPAAHPKEFRDDVVAVARRGDTPIAQIALDCGISESCLRNWMRRAGIEDGNRPGVTTAESEELRALRRRTRLLEQENEVPPGFWLLPTRWTRAAYQRRSRPARPRCAVPPGAPRAGGRSERPFPDVDPDLDGPPLPPESHAPEAHPDTSELILLLVVLPGEGSLHQSWGATSRV